MDTPNLSPIYEELLDYLVEKATPEEILNFSVSEAAQRRATELSERNNAGTLSSSERQELEQMMELDRFVSVLKAKAILALSK